MDNLKTAISRWIDTTEKNFENNTKTAFVESVSKACLLNDKSSTWLFGLAGASAAMVITQIDMLASYMTIGEIKITLSCLAISLLCGIAQKTSHTKSAVALSGMETMRDRLEVLLEDFTKEEDKITEMAKRNRLEMSPKMRLAEAMIETIDFLPIPAALYFKYRMKKILIDPNFNNKVLAKATFYQSAWLFLQSALFILFIAMTVTFIQV